MAASPSYKYRIFNKRESSGTRMNHSFDAGESAQHFRNGEQHGHDGNYHGLSNGLGPKSFDQSFDQARQSRSPTRRVDRSFDASHNNYSSSNGTRKVDRSFDASYYLNSSNNNLPSFSFSAKPSSPSTKFLNQSFDASGGESAGRFQRSNRLNRSFDGRSFEHTNNIYSSASRSSRQQHQSPNRNWTTSRSGEILDRSPERRDNLDRSFRAFNQAFNGVGGVTGEFEEQPLSLPTTNGLSVATDLRGRAPTRSAMRSSDRTFEKRSHEERYVRRTGVSLDRGSATGTLNRSFQAPGVSWKGQQEEDDDDLWTRDRPISFRSMVRQSLIGRIVRTL